MKTKWHFTLVLSAIHLIAVISTAAWADELPTGGCCLCDCIGGQYMAMETATDCADLGGNYLGDGTGITVAESTPNKEIPDGDSAGISDTITINNSFLISDLNVYLTIDHMYVGDLYITLSKAGGPSVDLIVDTSCPADNFDGIILDDEGGGGSIQEKCENNLFSPPNYVPANPLSAFDNNDSAGDWTLTVRDMWSQDIGVLVNWSLHIKDPSDCATAYPDQQCPVPDVRLFGTTGYGGDPSTLVELDPKTGAVLQEIGPVGYTVNGLDYDPITDTLYGGTSYKDPNFIGLIGINRETGAGTPVDQNNWGMGDKVAVTNITVNSAGQIYGWSEWCDCLVSIDKDTGMATEVGLSEIETASYGLSFDNSDMLYLMNWGGSFYQINTGTGYAFYKGDLNVGAAHHGDFHPVCGVYYGLSFDDPRFLLRCDLETQTCTTVGDPITGLHSLAFEFAGTTLENHPPVANAGQDQTVPIIHDKDPASDRASVTLDGTASGDPDDDDLVYSWKTDNVEIATGVNPTVDLEAGEYGIILTVTDPDGAISMDNVTVEVTAEPNESPVANAGNDQEVTSSGGFATVTLNGSGSSDSDGDSLTYSWSESSIVIATGVSPSVSLADGTHVITLTAADACDATDTDEVTVTVSPPVVSALDLSVVKVARRKSTKAVNVTMKVKNPNTATASNLTVTGGTLNGSDTNSALPLVLGEIKPGRSKQFTLQFSNVPAGEQTLAVAGTSSLGAFFTQTTVTVP